MVGSPMGVAVDEVVADPLPATVRARLAQRLDLWARAYLTPLPGGAGRNILQTLRDCGGHIPHVLRAPHHRVGERTPADEVEDIVWSMENAGWLLPACVLRLEYRIPALSVVERLDAVKRAGFQLSRKTYFVRLGEAEMFVAGALFG